MSSTPRARCSSARAPSSKRSRRGWPRSRAQAQGVNPRRAAPAEGPRALLRHLQHVVDGLLDQLIGEVGATALGGHDPGLTLEALERMMVESRLALGDARPPGGLVPALGRTGDAGAMAGAAHLIEHLGAILQGRGDRGGSGSPRVTLYGEGGVVMTGDRHLARCLEARGDVAAVVALFEDLPVLGLARHHAGKREDADGNGRQQADYHAEYVEEVGILFAHDARFRGNGAIWPRSIAALAPAR